MSIKLATTDISAIELGTTDVLKVMYGTTQIWALPTGATVPPTIVTTSTEFGTNMSVQAITAPTGVTAGNLLIAFAALDNSGTAMTASTGWTQIREAAHIAVVRLGVWARIADGSGSDALTITGAAQDYCASILRISGHGVSNIAADIRSAVTDGAAGTGGANPPNLDATTSQAYLWLAAAASDLVTGVTINTMPSGYTQAFAPLASASSASSAALGVAFKTATTQTEDPGPFNDIGQEWVTATLAIPGL